MAAPRTDICLIDDEIGLLDTFKEALKNDYQVRVFSSAQAALKEIDNGMAPNVIVTDLRMPHINGLEFIKELERRNMNSSLVLVSGNAEEEDVRKAMSAGVSVFLEKPFTMKHFKKVIADTFNLTGSKNLEASLGILVSEHFARTVEIEKFTVEAFDVLVENLESRRQFLDLVRSQRILSRRISEIKKQLGPE